MIKLDEINAHYVDHMGTDLTPVNAARISFGGESHEVSEKDEKLIRYLALHEHFSPFEHQSLTVLIECPLFIRSQIHRHRTFSYNEVSRRYTADDLSFYIPPTDDVRKQSRVNKQASDGMLEPIDAQWGHAQMIMVAESAHAIFCSLIERGVAREQARAVLPQSLMTKFYMTGNLRNWAHFLRLRLDAHAQLEVQTIAQKVAKIIEGLWPISYSALRDECPS